MNRKPDQTPGEGTRPTRIAIDHALCPWAGEFHADHADVVGKPGASGKLPDFSQQFVKQLRGGIAHEPVDGRQQESPTWFRASTVFRGA